MLFKHFGGVDSIPIVLESGSVEDLVETIARMAPSFGGINLEDISAPRCFEIEEQLKERLDIPVFHDDQHGTAIVVLAGLINGCRVLERSCPSSGSSSPAPGPPVWQSPNCFSGPASGTSSCVTVGASWCRRASTSPITSVRSPRRRIREGCTVALVRHSRGRRLCRCFGWAGPRRRHCPNVRWRHDLRAGESHPGGAPRPGSPVCGHRRHRAFGLPNQINNVLAFPGIFRGALDSGARQITEAMKLAAARAIADLVVEPTRRRDRALGVSGRCGGCRGGGRCWARLKPRFCVTQKLAWRTVISARQADFCVTQKLVGSQECQREASSAAYDWHCSHVGRRPVSSASASEGAFESFSERRVRCPRGGESDRRSSGCMPCSPVGL